MLDNVSKSSNFKQEIGVPMVSHFKGSFWSLTHTACFKESKQSFGPKDCKTLS